MATLYRFRLLHSLQCDLFVPLPSGESNPSHQHCHGLAPVPEACPLMNTAVSALPGIRPMLSMDLQRVVDLEMRIYPFPWTIGNFKDSLAAGYSCWVVVESGVIVAYAVVMIGVDEAHLLNLSVAPECQRKGLGSRLMGHLLEVARECEAARVLLEVRESNSAGRHFYATQRFASIGVRRGYYPAQDGREDAIVMELAL